MSVVVITIDDFETVRRIVSALRRQTVASQLEVVFVGPTSPPSGFAAEDVEGFAAWQSVAAEDLSSTAHMRALGTLAANAPIVAFCEDHCFPAPEWAATLISRHREDWAGVGAVVENANPRTALSWSNLLIEYGDWLAPHPSGPIHHIGGHNSSYKRRILVEIGPLLPAKLEAESTLQWELAESGHRFFLDEDARIFHMNMELFWESLKSHFNGSRLFAGNRRRDWTSLKRAIYFCGSPLIPLVRLVKSTANLQRTQRLAKLPGLLPTLLPLLMSAGLGEMVGYGFGPGRSGAYVTSIEFHRDRYLRHRRLRPELDELLSN